MGNDIVACVATESIEVKTGSSKSYASLYLDINNDGVTESWTREAEMGGTAEVSF
jgi:hypothetical protein